MHSAAQLDTATKDLESTRESLSAAVDRASKAEAAVADEAAASAGMLEEARRALAEARGEAAGLAAESEERGKSVEALREQLEHTQEVCVFWGKCFCFRFGWGTAAGFPRPERFGCAPVVLCAGLKTLY